MSELLARMSSREFTAWLAYDRLEPIGAIRGDYHAALIASTMANVHRDPKRRAYTIEEFLLFRSVGPARSPEELRAKLSAISGAGKTDGDTSAH